MNYSDKSLVTVRDLTENEIPFLLNYWFHSPPGFITAMGVDPAKMPSPADFEQGLRNKIAENASKPTSELNALVIEHDGQPIGFHTINPLIVGDHGIFHAHIWDPAYRGHGLGLSSYPQACRIFMERFRLQKIMFKTPIQNKGAIRVKEKLGIRYLGEEKVSISILKDNTPTKVFELTAAELEHLPA